MRLKLLLIGFCVCVMGISAFAVPTIQITNSGNPKVILVGTEGLPGHAAGTSFNSFCIEALEDYDTNINYYVKIDTAAVKGGELVRDPLNPKTAWLYNQYLDGAFPEITSDSMNSYLFKNALWMIEDELKPGDGGYDLTNTYYVAAQNCNWTDIQNIRVMTLWKEADFTGHRQDFLIRVPAPGALLLGSMGMGLVGWLRRRRAL